MPSFALLLCSIASLLGALAVAPLPADLRICVAAGLGALALFASRRGGSPPRQLRLLLALCLAAAALDAQVHQRLTPPLLEHRTARYGATLLERNSAGDGSTSIVVALENGLHVLARVRDPVPIAGSRLLIRGRLEPFDDGRNPGEPSERDLERERGLDGRLDGAAILSTTPSKTWNLPAWLARAHEWAHARLRERLGEPDATVLAGELWGERSTLPPAVRTEFQETGTVHVLVTAGLHLGAVAGLVLALLTLLALPRWSACLAAIVLIWIFAWWSGGQLPAVRAATMATAALTARAFGRATFSWNTLAIAALAITFLRPASVATISFALSFSCVGAIFACAAPLERWIEARVALPDRVREALVLSLATQLGVWPLGAAAFLQFTPYAIVANLAVVPCVAATMALGAAQLALAWCDPLAQVCANWNSWLQECVIVKDEWERL